MAKALERPGNPKLLVELRGVGPKTVDYLKMLVGLPDLAVDRHIRLLVSRAGLSYTRYEDIKNVVGLAADELGIRRDTFDKAIWAFFSLGQTRRPQDLASFNH